MNGILINIDPILIRIGGFEVGWHGVATAVAIIVAVWVAMREARRRGISEEFIQTLALFGVIGGIVGARLFHVVDKLDYYMANPFAIFALQEGGLAIWGGVIGGVVAGIFYTRYRGLLIGKVADLCVPALLTGQIIGRIGCAINGDAYGGPTTLPWGFIYQNPNDLIPQTLVGIPTHPYPVYEMLWNLALLGLLLVSRRRLRTEGLVFTGYVAGYSLGRLFLTFVREEQIVVLGLQQAQVVALSGLVVAGLLVIYLKVFRVGRSPAVTSEG